MWCYQIPHFDFKYVTKMTRTIYYWFKIFIWLLVTIGSDHTTPVIKFLQITYLFVSNIILASTVHNGMFFPWSFTQRRPIPFNLLIIICDWSIFVVSYSEFHSCQLYALNNGGHNEIMDIVVKLMNSQVIHYIICMCRNVRLLLS